MSHSHQHHCACNNPIMDLLQDSICHPDNVAKMQVNAKPGGIFGGPDPVVFTGGTIRPLVNGDCTPVEAIGFADGLVIESGPLGDVQQAMAGYKHVQYVTLEPTWALLPGLIEPHVHIVPTAVMATWVNVSPFTGQNLTPGYSLEWVANAIKNYDNGLFEVILGTGLDAALLMPQDNISEQYQLINNEVMDGVKSDAPVIILSASGHTLYLNTLGYHHVFNNSSAVRKQYGTVENYISQTNGTLEEMLLMTPAMDTVKEEIISKSILVYDQLDAMFAQANSRGVTFMYDALMNEQNKNVLAPYMKLFDRPMRVGAAAFCTSKADVDNLGVYTQPKVYEDIYYGHVKIVSDGSNQGLTGYQSSPYLCDPGNYGVFDIPSITAPLSTVPLEYQHLIDHAVKKYKWPLMIHANGDQAINFTIMAYQKAIGTHAGKLRHRIEHCSLATEADLNQMQNAGISPSFLIGHVGYWGYAFQQVIFGEDKTNTLDLCQYALSKQMKISLHSDHNVTPLGPLRMMEQSITRAMEADPALQPLNSGQCLTAEQALIAVTVDAAWQCYADQWTGSLAAGNFADFTILNTDPLTMQDVSMKMRDIPVLETWVKGVKVYDNNNADL